MTLKITPASIVSDGHVVLLPAGLTGQVTTADGTTYDFGPAHQEAIEVNSHDHAKEVALVASQLAVEHPGVDIEEFDEALSRKNLGMKKG
jgi:hypothetical protein